MNDLSTFDGDGDRNRQICDLRVKGKTEVEVCQMLGVTIADIHRALDKAAQASMTPQARVRDIWLDKSRLEEYERALVPAAIAGDLQAIATAVRVQERKHTLTGANAPLRVDPIQLAQEAGPRLTSTQELRKVLDDFRAQDKRALRNGGPGCGDWRDDADREEMARKKHEREKANADD